MKTLKLFNSATFQLLLLSPILFLTLSTCSYLPEKQEVSETLIIEENRDFIIITPRREWYSMTGLVFYPGGLVDPHAYVETLSKFALSGIMHEVVIVKMPANLAVLDADKAKWMYNRFGYVKRWVVAGHSLGGVSACKLIHNWPHFFYGLALFAAYPQKSSDISWYTQSVLSIRGEHDGNVSQEDIDKSIEYLPPSLYINSLDEFPMEPEPRTVHYTIPGGNHAYFGKYGEQRGDGEATISQEDQTKETVNILQKWFDSYGWDK